MSTSKLPTVDSSCNRAISRRRRLVRFLSTMFRPCFGTTMPTLGPSEREADIRASRHSVCIRFPVRLTDSRSAALVSRDLRGKPRDLRAGVFRRKLDRQTLTSLFAPTAENLASPFSSHAQPEPVGSDTAFIARTIGG